MSNLLAFGVIQKNSADTKKISNKPVMRKKKEKIVKESNDLVSKIRAKENSPVAKKKPKPKQKSTPKKFPKDFDDTPSYASFEPLEEEKHIPLASNEEFISDTMHGLEDDIIMPYEVDEEEECKEDDDDDSSNITYEFSDTVSESSETTGDSENNSMMIDKKYTSAWKQRDRKPKVRQFTGPQLTIDFDSDSD